MLLCSLILLIDDDIDDHEIFMCALEKVSPQIELRTAINGLQALSILSRGDMLPGLIFLDINMPGMDGFQVLSEIKKREELKEIPVIMYSTASTPASIAKATLFGAFGFISKPESFAELENKLREILLVDNQGI